MFNPLSQPRRAFNNKVREMFQAVWTAENPEWLTPAKRDITYIDSCLDKVQLYFDTAASEKSRLDKFQLRDIRFNIHSAQDTLRTLAPEQIPASLEASFLKRIALSKEALAKYDTLSKAQLPLHAVGATLAGGALTAVTAGVWFTSLALIPIAVIDLGATALALTAATYAAKKFRAHREANQAIATEASTLASRAHAKVGNEEPGDLALALTDILQEALTNPLVNDQIMQSLVRLTQLLDSLLILLDENPEPYLSHMISATIRDYIPRSLETYTSTVTHSGSTHRLPSSRTPKEELLYQLAMIQKALQEAKTSFAATGASQVVHGKFLEDKFSN